MLITIGGKKLPSQRKKVKTETKGGFFNPQFWNKNGWHGMLGIIRIVWIKKTPVEMRSRDTSKHCVTNMAAGEEAAIAAVIAAIFLVNKEEEENRETVLDLPNVLAVLQTKERRHPSNHGFLIQNITEKNLVLLVQ